MKEKIKSTRVTLSPDGKYRWTYSKSLFKDPTIFLLIWKIFFFILLGISAFILLLGLIEGTLPVLSDLAVFGYILLGMTLLVGVGYLIYALIMGGYYTVEFEMDEKGINHRQTAVQAEKAKKLGKATAFAGAASGRIGAAGIGMSAQRTEMYTEFSKVRKIKLYPCRDLIKVNERFGHNQVYALKEDFEFVRDFIVSNCKNVK